MADKPNGPFLWFLISSITSPGRRRRTFFYFALDFCENGRIIEGVIDEQYIPDEPRRTFAAEEPLTPVPLAISRPVLDIDHTHRVGRQQLFMPPAATHKHNSGKDLGLVTSDNDDISYVTFGMGWRRKLNYQQCLNSRCVCFSDGPQGIDISNVKGRSLGSYSGSSVPCPSSPTAVVATRSGAGCSPCHFASVAVRLAGTSWRGPAGPGQVDSVGTARPSPWARWTFLRGRVGGKPCRTSDNVCYSSPAAPVAASAGPGASRRGKTSHAGSPPRPARRELTPRGQFPAPDGPPAVRPGLFIGEMICP